MKPHDFSSEPKGDRTSRRRFLKQTAGLAAGAAVWERIAPAGTVAPAEPLLPTIKLGPHAVTRLVIGGNPIYGFSHFNKLFSEHQKAWHTPERVVELLQHCEVKGLKRGRSVITNGPLRIWPAIVTPAAKMNWLCLSKPDWGPNPEMFEAAAKLKPIGIAPHGAGRAVRRQNKLDVLADILKRIRDTGVRVGLSAHDPALIELSKKRVGRGLLYVRAAYYLTRAARGPRKSARPERAAGRNLSSHRSAAHVQNNPADARQNLFRLQNSGSRAGAVESPAQVRACVLKRHSPTSNQRTA
jgi:hypothetical protein